MCLHIHNYIKCIHKCLNIHNYIICIYMQVRDSKWGTRSLRGLCCNNEAVLEDEIPSTQSRGLPFGFWPAKQEQLCFMEAKWAWENDPGTDAGNLKVWLLLLVLGFLSSERINWTWRKAKPKLIWSLMETCKCREYINIPNFHPIDALDFSLLVKNKK